MGILSSCCKPSAIDVRTPDVDTRRRQQVEAAERRRAEADSRGIKDPERLRRQQQRSEEMERREHVLGQQGGPTLRWTSN